MDTIVGRTFDTARKSLSLVDSPFLEEKKWLVYLTIVNTGIFEVKQK